MLMLQGKYKKKFTELLKTCSKPNFRLVNADFPPDHFSYVFIDESGNCTETETLIPIAGILTSSKSTISGQIVLIGDPKQLGSITHSPLAMQYGFSNLQCNLFFVL